MEWDLGLCDTKLGDTRPGAVWRGVATQLLKSGESEVSECQGDFKEVYDTQNCGRKIILLLLHF